MDARGSHALSHFGYPPLFSDLSLLMRRGATTTPTRTANDFVEFLNESRGGQLWMSRDPVVLHGVLNGGDINVVNYIDGNVTVAGIKRLKLDSGGSSSMSDPVKDDDTDLTLTLCPPGQQNFHEERLPPAPLYVQPLQPAAVAAYEELEPERSRPRRARPVSVDRPIAKIKEERIPPPYAWATDRRAVLHTYQQISSAGIVDIPGDVICKRCDGSQTLNVEFRKYFLQLDKFFSEEKHSMHDRAPKSWMVPHLLTCAMCKQTDCVKPIISQRKRHINWLFLLLTQTLGLCTLDQLKYFCKHTHKHRTGAKDRVLYLTYVGLLKQLQPDKQYD